MNYYYQTTTKNCFNTCFRNAMRHFDIALTPVLEKWLGIFEEGMQSCTIHAARLGLVIYGRSLRRFREEWEYAQRCEQYGKRIDQDAPMEWACELLHKGVRLGIRNDPIHNRESILAELAAGNLVLCDIAIPNNENPKVECKHACLLLCAEDGKIFAHDPLKSNLQLTSDNGDYIYSQPVSNCNLKINIDYFFSEKPAFVKPLVTHSDPDCGYSFVTICRT